MSFMTTQDQAFVSSIQDGTATWRHLDVSQNIASTEEMLRAFCYSAPTRPCPTSAALREHFGAQVVVWPVARQAALRAVTCLISPPSPPPSLLRAPKRSWLPPPGASRTRAARTTVCGMPDAATAASRFGSRSAASGPKKANAPCCAPAAERAHLGAKACKTSTAGRYSLVTVFAAQSHTRSPSAYAAW